MWLTGELEGIEGRFAAGARRLPVVLRAGHLPGPRENQEPLQVLRQILQPDLGSGSREANRANQFPTHRGDLVTEHMFDSGANPRANSITRFLLSGVLRYPFS